MKILKENKGITLVALVITIIVLLILAGVTLSLVLGENGIIPRVEQSKEETIKAQVKEEIERKILEYKTVHDGEFNLEEFFEDNSLLESFTKNNEEYSLTNEGYTFFVDEYGNITDAYKLCEYLESTGTQYIDTGISCNNSYKWEYELMQLTAGTANTCVNGAIEQIGTSSTYKRFHNVNNVNNQWKFYVGINDTQSTYTAVGANVRTKISVDVRNIPANVNIKSQNDSLNVSSYNNITSLNFWLFRRNSNLEQYKFWTTERIYSFKVLDNKNKYVMNLIPCLDNNSVSCMYDTVSKTAFYNQGTGTFEYKLK